MSNIKIDFYDQVAFLDQYIHSSDPGKDADKLKDVIEILRLVRIYATIFFVVILMLHGQKFFGTMVFFLTLHPPKTLNMGM